MFEERFPLMGENLSKFFGTKRVEEMGRFSREVRTFSARRQKKEIDELSSQAESWPRADWDIYSFVFRVCFEWDDKTIVFCICIDKKNTCLLRRTNRFEITLNHNKISTNMEIFPTFPFRFMERLTVYLFFFIEIRLFDFGVLKCNFL